MFFVEPIQGEDIRIIMRGGGREKWHHSIFSKYFLDLELIVKLLFTFDENGSIFFNMPKNVNFTHLEK